VLRCKIINRISFFAQNLQIDRKQKKSYIIYLFIYTVPRKYVYKSKYAIIAVNVQLRERISPNLHLFLRVKLDSDYTMFSEMHQSYKMRPISTSKGPHTP
jgi:hypothetical protein